MFFYNTYTNIIKLPHYLYFRIMYVESITKNVRMKFHVIIILLYTHAYVPYRAKTKVTIGKIQIV